MKTALLILLELMWRHSPSLGRCRGQDETAETSNEQHVHQRNVGRRSDPTPIRRTRDKAGDKEKPANSKDTAESSTRRGLVARSVSTGAQ